MSFSNSGDSNLENRQTNKTDQLHFSQSFIFTVGRLLQDLRPHGHHAIDDDEPKGDEWDKVIELVGPVHHHTQD